MKLVKSPPSLRVIKKNSCGIVDYEEAPVQKAQRVFIREQVQSPIAHQSESHAEHQADE